MAGIAGIIQAEQPVKNWQQDIVTLQQVQAVRGVEYTHRTHLTKQSLITNTLLGLKAERLQSASAG